MSSLEYLNIDGCKGLTCMPKGLGELTSVQRLDRFIVNRVEKSFSNAAMLNELRDLNYLGNCLGIEQLNLVELESMKAILKKKKRLQSFRLYWRSLEWSASSSERVDSEKDESLLNILEPHPNLKGLKVSGY
ncbi:hypothetical protein POUND7_006873 [Theobroma cacao]